MTGGFQKSKINSEDVTDDIIVKGVDNKNDEANPKPITYSESPDPDDRRCLDINVCNTDEFPGGGNSKNFTPCYSSKKTFDSDASTVALTGSFVDQYSYTGTGKFIGFVMAFDHKDVEVKLLVDGDTVFQFTAADIETHQGNTLVDENLGINWEPNKKIITYYPRFPICFETDVKIQARETAGSHSRSYYLVSIEKVS